MADGSAQATFCATLVDEWVRGGVTRAVVCPGSRSTPLAIALSNHPGLDVIVHPDERSASFLALGLSLELFSPTVLLTTSGTAAAELHAAVIEASLSCVPLLVCTADRPPELLGRGSPQTIDQTNLFGDVVRWYHNPGVADENQAHTWRALASKSLLASLGQQPGPVHLNFPFRDPLVGTPSALPAGRGEGPWQRRWEGMRHAPDDGRRVAALCQSRRGLIVAGAGSPAGLVELAERLGWPILADARSNLGGSSVVIGTADATLRVDTFADRSSPDIVLRVGEQPTSRVIWEWLAHLDTHRVHLMQAGMPWLDTSHDVDLSISSGDLAGLVDEISMAVDAPPVLGWLEQWQADEEAAQAAIEAVLAVSALSEPAVARSLTAALPEGARLVVSSSMPIRDVDWFARRRGDVVVHANRGANGIDGVVSTAVGVAVASASPTALHIGDLAFLHDSNGLV
ncbi:MAG: 2-succinyl-5-enolpyruvyl-6-hydroxy-3-cyclohexene-1-carboxylic-acid synthase, partial [Acidimicrobiales bacterium]